MADDERVFLNSHRDIDRHLRHDIEPQGFDSNGIRFVLCDHRNCVVVHVHVRGVPEHVAWDECLRTLDLLASPLARTGSGALLIALTRPGPLRLRPADSRWLHAARKFCADGSVRLLGVHLVTPRGQREVCLDDAL